MFRLFLLSQIYKYHNYYSIQILIPTISCQRNDEIKNDDMFNKILKPVISIKIEFFRIGPSAQSS